jgi:hypothetical protein
LVKGGGAEKKGKKEKRKENSYYLVLDVFLETTGRLYMEPKWSVSGAAKARQGPSRDGTG